MRILIKDGTVINPFGEKSGRIDILTDGSKVVKLGQGLPEDGAK